MAQTSLENEITIRYRGVEPGLPKRQTNPVKKAALEQGIVYWFDNYRKKHFTAAGAKEYGYQPRDGEKPGTSQQEFFKSYTGRKLKRFGHRRPLFYSGESERLTRIRKITASPRAARWSNSARKFNFRANPKAPDMGKEMTTVSQREIKRLVLVYDKHWEKGVQRIQDEKTVKVA